MTIENIKDKLFEIITIIEDTPEVSLSDFDREEIVTLNNGMNEVYDKLTNLVSCIIKEE